MHIPDGYLGPLFSLGTGIITIPTWSLAVRRVQRVLNHRTVPLLAIFAAFSFTIMMFNVPVPGGTTAHGVGGTLIAVVLGPWAAVIGVSMALIIQALFFGDGGILAIFANCLNMAIILPFSGYYTYRLIAARSDVLSPRRVWAAGIGAYVGITAAAIAVGFELGLQPLLYHANGLPLYSPYNISTAIPAMLISHILGASFVEAFITALGMAYLQKRHPEYLTSLRRIVAGPDTQEGQVSRRPWWQIATGVTVFGLLILIIAGLVTGGGDPAHLFGADWSQVNWPDIATMLVVVAIIAVILIPLTWFLLPRRLKGVGTAFTALSILAPLGLITPGFAFGEGSTEDVHAAFGYVPEGLQRFSTIFSAPLGDYNLPGSFFSDANAPLWHAAIGYEISGIIGILLLGVVMWLLGRLLSSRNVEITTPGTTKA